jgi:hypothetical protein
MKNLGMLVCGIIFGLGVLMAFSFGVWTGFAVLGVSAVGIVIAMRRKR